MRVMLVPQLRSDANLHLGINQCIRGWQKWLPRHGVELVDTAAKADVVHHAIGSESQDRVDVLSFHGLHPTAQIDEGDGAWHINARVIAALRRARKVVAVSEWIADLIRRDMRFEPTVIPNGVDPADWADVKPGGYSTAKYVLWAKNRIGGVCDPEPLNTLAAMAPNVAFVTTFGEETDNVTVTDLVPWTQMRKMIMDASVYLATTKETWGIQTLEAMLCGVPVLGFNWGGTAEIVDHGINGYLAEPFDYEDLLHGLRECLKHRKAWGAAAHEKVVANWHWRDLSEKLVAVYEDAAKPRTGPRVTVVIPCHNYGRDVGRAIRSVLRQSYGDFELIVIDDGSTDDSWDEIQEAAKEDPRIKILRQENRGVSHARNRAIAMGSGEFIACLDADDAMATDFLKVLVQALERAPRDVGVVYSSLALMQEDGTGVKSRWPPQYDFSQFRQQRGNCVPSLCLFRREAWERTGGFRQRFKPIEDGDLWMRMGSLGFRGMKVSENVLFLYHYHADSATVDEAGHIRPTPDNLKWQPWMQDHEPPFACLGNPPRGSWPVRNYDRPLVSVIIPVGPGHEDTVVDALDSLLAQTERQWEAVVITDTGKPLSLMGYPFARIVDGGGKPKGTGAARNMGIAVAKAPLILCLDADDYLEPEFLRSTLAVWREYGGIVYTDCFLQRDGEAIEHEFPDWDPALLFKGTILAVTSLMPKKVWEDVGGFDESLDSFEDWVFWIDACLKGWCGTRIPEPLFTYRHLTGQRREVGVEMKASMRPYFEEKYRPYLVEGKEMGCSGCGGRRQAVRQLVNAARAGGAGGASSARQNSIAGRSNEMAEPILVRYTGPAVGMRTYKVHGRMYRCDAHNRDFYVMGEDVDFFSSRAEFEIVAKTPKPKTPKAKAEEPQAEAVAADAVATGEEATSKKPRRRVLGL
jgi:glycosyltransferase involved in cell wall biosynthesis